MLYPAHNLFMLQVSPFDGKCKMLDNFISVVPERGWTKCRTGLETTVPDFTTSLGQA